MAGLKVAITANETTALGQLDSTTQGFLVPRMTTTQRDAIGAPATGLLIYNTTTGRHEEYTGAAWRAVGTGAAGVTSTGEIFLTAAGGWPSTTNGCADATKNEYTTNDEDLYSLDFDPDSDEYAQWSVWMPDNWDAGTVTAKFCWTAASDSGDVIWGLQGRSYANDDPIDAAWGTAQTVTDTLIATDDIHYTSATAAITLAGTPAAGELVQFRAYRDADAGGDTLGADAQLIGIKCYYTRS
jgi:hypothetical protein